MPVLPERLIHSILLLSLAVFLLSVLLILLAIGRRIIHERQFKLLDRFRARLGSLFDDLRDGRKGYDEALAEVSGISSPRFTLVLEQLLLERLDTDADAALVRRMAEDLGLVAAWHRRLEPPGGGGIERRALPGVRRLFFAPRARTAANLGRVRHERSWRLLAEALKDPSGEVQRVALRSLAAIEEPESFPILVEYSRRALTLAGSRISDRELRSALVQFPLTVSRRLTPLLVDSNPKLRLFAADVLIGMLATAPRGNGLPTFEDPECGRELVEVVRTTLASDPNPEVRARAATLLGSVEDGAGCLVRLLRDEVWFVRLRAVRALSERKDGRYTVVIAARLIDSHWRVRDAAAAALVRSGAPGFHELRKTLLATQDAYAREQTIEALETSGELSRTITRCAKESSARDWEVLRKFVRMGKTRRLETAIAGLAQPAVRAALLDGVAASADPQVQAWASLMMARSANGAVR